MSDRHQHVHLVAWWSVSQHNYHTGAAGGRNGGVAVVMVGGITGKGGLCSGESAGASTSRDLER